MGVGFGDDGAFVVELDRVGQHLELTSGAGGEVGAADKGVIAL